MRFRYVMRYYHPFPEAIPLSKAGSSRVTHPSATKKITEIIFSVRLACVRRAASVRPEPGSNSLLSLYIKYLPVFTISRFITIARNSFACVFTLVLISQLIQNLQGFCFFLALFNFQDTFALSLPLSARLLYHFFSLLSIPFGRKKFSDFALSRSTALLLYHLLTLLSMGLERFPFL